MRKWILLVGFLSIFQGLRSQEVTGTITDKQSGEVLLFVNIIGPEKRGTVSDENGAYRLELPVGQSKVSVSFIGYNSQTFNLNLKDQEVFNLDIQLVEKTKTLETVVLSTSKF